MPIAWGHIGRWLLVLPAALVGACCIIAASWGAILGTAWLLTILDWSNTFRFNSAEMAPFLWLLFATTFTFVVSGALAAPAFGRRLAAFALVPVAMLILERFPGISLGSGEASHPLWYASVLGAFCGVGLVSYIVAKGNHPNQWGSEWMQKRNR